MYLTSLPALPFPSELCSEFPRSLFPAEWSGAGRAAVVTELPTQCRKTERGHH